MRRFRITFVTIISFVAILVSACAPKSEPVIMEGPPLPATTEPAITEEPTKPAATEQSTEPQFTEFNANNFGHSTAISNPWDPLQPGMFWAYEGTAVDGGQNVTRRIEFTVTDLTKEIDGVRTVVAWIEDYTNDELTEKEIAFYAQDNDGNVWYFGEHPEDYENGQFADAPTWLAGIADAKPGIKMLASPQLGDPSLFQGWGPAVEWSDYGQVDQTGQQACVPVKCYDNVLVMAESSLGEEGAYQLKYYAQGVGNIQVGWKGTDETKEELELVEYKQLSAEELAALHTQALALETHAYEVSPDVYGKTKPMQ